MSLWIILFLWSVACNSAANGRGTTSPNPMVGTVIVHHNRIIGEGWHHHAGAAHAEVNAVAAVHDKTRLRQATLYVSLEPCAHHGLTPPCADLIIDQKIPQVVVGSRDPFAEVDGKGIAKMRAAGIEVTTGIMQRECNWLNRRFFTFHQKQRPYIILKWAQTQDGYIDHERAKGERGVNWITTPETRNLVHQWRAQEDAIMVGGGTVLNDDPALSVRDASGRQPTRIVLSQNEKIPPDAQVFDGQIPSLYFSETAPTSQGQFTHIDLKPGKEALDQVMAEAYQRGIQSILVEGGAGLLHSFIKKNLWDEARVLTGKGYYSKGLKAPLLGQRGTEKLRFGQDQLEIFYR
ncbi:MAG: bifunctional diaminohydroxyphosphoribosylaminopyrimidine deaminase/5-amino-6-(5-phosphoribosylamino)uracil reductase RibD [Owenweeksia sp.]|nr:bifunctional diaminohydroxyphosphoribosylaminopyrimidine deaminase/5-amino-6-(5-phosphoribosylamino)uracil reductase RibD [Owenweeksia sp.]